MQLKPGVRLQSTTCETQVIVVRGNGDVDLQCGGQAMVPTGTAAVAATLDETQAAGTLLGKRYASDELGFEVLCTRSGAGSLSVGDTPIHQKDAKPLPSSD